MIYSRVGASDCRAVFCSRGPESSMAFRDPPEYEWIASGKQKHWRKWIQMNGNHYAIVVDYVVWLRSKMKTTAGYITPQWVADSSMSQPAVAVIMKIVCQMCRCVPDWPWEISRNCTGYLKHVPTSVCMRTDRCRNGTRLSVKTKIRFIRQACQQKDLPCPKNIFTPSS